MKKILFSVLFLFSLLHANAVERFPNDSINSIVLQKKISVDEFLKEASSLSHTENKNFRQLIQELFNHAKKTKNEKLRGHAYHLYASYYENNLQMDSSLICMEKALSIQTAIGDSAGLISTYFGFGNRYDIQGVADSSLHYYFKALDIAEKTTDSLRIGYAMMGIGNVYSENKQPENAKDVYRQSLIYFSKTSEIAMSWIYNNLGEVYVSQDSINLALALFEESLTIKKKNNDWYGVLFTNNNIGDILLNKGEDPEKALDYYFQSLRAGQKAGVEKEQISVPYVSIGEAYLFMKKYDLALNYQDSSLQIAIELNSLDLIARNYLLQAKIYTGKKEYKKANEALNIYVLYNDSLLSEKSLEQVNQLSARYENEKKELEISNLEKDKKAQRAEIKQQEAENLIYILGLGLASLLIFFVTIAFLQKRKANILIQKQKDEIEIQKDLVEEKNSEILDSISYAQRIQQSILPPKKVVKAYLPESFILYLPKDIVSGDFYWMDSISIKNDDIILFAAVDCTGHGVPGAMVSVICHNALNKAVQEFKLTSPADILNKVEEMVKESFSDKDNNVNDGMDIALCSLNYNSKELQYAGANNPLWIIRNNTKEIEAIHANKQGIGGIREKTPFINHTVQLQKGDSLYIFSDGYADQFGGPKGKKIMRKQFKKILIDGVEKNANEQRETLKDTFVKWKGNLEQIDDVCVIGVKL